MNFLQRYNHGETVQVYADIYDLGQAAFSEAHYADIHAVMQETMRRVAFNLETIHHELEGIGYNFKRHASHSFEKPLLKPFLNTQYLQTALDNVVLSFGHVPVSLKLFYSMVGSCNFAWDYDTNKNIPWAGADPIQIMSLDDQLAQVTDKYWTDDMTEIRQDCGTAYLELSADYYHKDNISGGPAYSIELTSVPSIDGHFLNEEHRTTFINYLRIVTFENCGFGRIHAVREDASFEKFYNNVKPKLKAL